MTLITDQTRLKLLNNLANAPTANATDLMFIQRSLKSFNFKYEDLVTGLPDNSSLEADSNKLRIKDGGVTTTKIADNNVTLGKIQTIGDDRLLGNVSGGGNVGEVAIEQTVSGSSDIVVSSAGIQQYLNAGLASQKQVAIIREEQPNGYYVDGTTTATGGTGWRNTYDPNNYTENIFYRQSFSQNLRFFQRNLNDVTFDDGIIESFSNKKFTLSEGTYHLNAWGWIEDSDLSVVRLKRHYSTAYGTKYITGLVHVFPSAYDKSNVLFNYLLEVPSGTADERTYSFEQGSDNDSSKWIYGRPYQLSGLEEVYFQVEILKLS